MRQRGTPLGSLPQRNDLDRLAGLDLQCCFVAEGAAKAWLLLRELAGPKRQPDHGARSGYRGHHPVRGERLGRVAAEHEMLPMLCDQCALERGLAEGEIGAALPTGTVAGVRVGCFPDLYAALAGDPPDHIITL
jgi:hypothetical protein